MKNIARYLLPILCCLVLAAVAAFAVTKVMKSRQECLKVDGKVIVIEGREYVVYGDAPLIEDYYLVQVRAK